LKLLLSEIEFLTPYYYHHHHHSGHTVVVLYAGAAPGVHIPILARMFPAMRFVLVDPARSMISNGEYANIEVVQEYMSDELAEKFSAQQQKQEQQQKKPPLLLFISDVRVGAAAVDTDSSSSSETDEAQQLRIQRDMDAQRRWVEILRPLSSMLKFRLPWSISAKTNYLSGRIHFPVYGKQLTHETRLIVPRDAPAMDYDNVLYERQMAYFNQVLRPAIQPLFLLGGRCYDCTAFRWIMCGYLRFAGLCCEEGEGDNLQLLSTVDARCHQMESELEQLKKQWWQSSSGSSSNSNSTRSVAAEDKKPLY
jgi:hypothetical protein